MITLTITHDGDNWIASNDAVRAEAASLTQLDRKLKELLQRQGYRKPDEQLELLMTFDNATLPVWMRQYAQHYFNRTVRIEDR